MSFKSFNPFDVLNKQGKQAEMPTGGEFGINPFVGPAQAVVRWMWGSYTELDRVLDPDLPAFILNRFGEEGGWINYYFASPEDANRVKESQGEGFVRQVWHWTMDANRELTRANVAGFAEKWGGVIGADCTIASLSAWKSRHEYHQITLPGFVQAIATAQGWVDTHIFHVDEILDPDLAFTDEFQARMIGPAGRPQKGESKLYQASVYWQRRASLWKALGEDNPEAFIAAEDDSEEDNPEASISEGDSKFVTNSEKLSAILNMVQVMEWTAPLWAKFYLLPDPRADALTKKGARLTLPYVAELYESEAEAKKAAAELVVGDGSTASVPTSSSGAPIPAAWEKYPDDWANVVASIKEIVGDKLEGPLPVVTAYREKVEAVVKDKHPSGLGATTEEVIDWL